MSHCLPGCKERSGGPLLPCVACPHACTPTLACPPNLPFAAPAAPPPAAAVPRPAAAAGTPLTAVGWGIALTSQKEAYEPDVLQEVGGWVQLHASFGRVPAAFRAFRLLVTSMASASLLAVQ